LGKINSIWRGFEINVSKALHKHKVKNAPSMLIILGQSPQLSDGIFPRHQHLALNFWLCCQINAILGPSSLPVVVASLTKDCMQNCSAVEWYDRHKKYKIFIIKSIPRRVVVDSRI